jgi:peptide/nickel transport system permease protein
MKLRYYVIRRLLLLIPTIIGVTLIIFLLTNVIGNPIRCVLGEKSISADTIKALEEYYGLDKPLYMQYFHFLNNLLHGNLGLAIHTPNTVLEDLFQRLPATIELGIFALIIAIPLGILLGIISAIKKDKPLDHVTRIFALGGVSMPIFWLGLMALLLFYYILPIFPGPGRLSTGIELEHITGFYLLDSLLTRNWVAFKDALWHIILPGLCLSWHSLATITRMARGSMLEVMREEYIKTARSKGLNEGKVIYKHALRNALIPTTTVIGLSLSLLFAGAILTESVFSWPGIGLYALDSVIFNDTPAIMGFVTLVGLSFVLINLVVDIAYAIIDPRIRYA